ncbi:unnamed protein product [Darwinula stevensoni]|uniref:CRAL-TRIO domain-containing protein n=1 Tax=Darwinula stevensoni TaxID=69355 RepID=A0A7R9FSU7_9CRUS|nr:unnamed protein product [Darwinula stevensoni]CAG0904242.1 unnamed protein product [Darwinula stevensoni]
MILCRAISCAYVQHLEWRDFTSGLMDALLTFRGGDDLAMPRKPKEPMLELPIFLVDQGGTDLKGILSCISKEDYIRWGIQIAEKGLLERRRSLGNGNGNGNGNGPAYQFVFIVELQGWNFSDVFFKPVLDTVLGLMQMQEANYPEYLKRIYVLNLPWFFAMFLGLVKQFLRQATQEKIVCLGSKEQYEPVLTQAISKEVLPKFWGGERVDEDGDPRCSSLIGKGGKVPRSLYRTGRDAKEEAEMEEEKGEC